MKNIKEVLDNRRSYRNYTSEPVAMDLIDAALKSAQRTATSVNGQQLSVIKVTDQKVLDQLCEINWGQKHIQDASCFLVFVVDFNRAEKIMEVTEIEIHNHIESILVGAVDAGLLAQSVELYLQANEVGTCMIGGIRQNMLKVREMLKIKGLAFPVLGMTVGNVEQFENSIDLLRPRVNFESFAMNEIYNQELVQSEVIKYNDELTKWWDSKQMTGHRAYKESMESFYSKNYIPDELEQLQEIGFIKNYSDNNPK